MNRKGLIINKKLLIGILLIVIISIAIFTFCILKPTIMKEKNILVISEEEAREKLSQVKVAILYEKITDGIYCKSPYRSLDGMIALLKETKTDFIFRGWWRWSPCPESPETAPSPLYYERGYTYQQLEETLAQIKSELPDIIFCGAIPAQRINFEERNPITGKTYEKDETWDMALDPAKWGITKVSKKDLQEYFQEHGTGKNGYYPDITNPEFQKLLLSWAEKQIDCGADAIWIDGLYGQARILRGITKNSNHPAVKESYEAASKIIDKIHNYGYSKGKYIYVGTWWSFGEFPYPPPKVDFVTMTPSVEEVISMRLNDSRWDREIKEIRDELGDIPVFVFIDWADTTDTPLGKFSQALTPEEQKEFLKIADKFFQERGINFIYPLHGGYMGEKATITSFDNQRIYDSIAPEFDTYKTIVELTQNKINRQ